MASGVDMIHEGSLGRRAGTTVPTNDIWIASCALHVDAQVVTFDSDFDRFGDLDRRVLVA